jgi:leucyl-tRNA synthetase
MVEEDGRLSPAVVPTELSLETARVLHQTIKKVTEDVESLRFNTAISQMMVLTNELTKLVQKPRSVLESLVKLLSPFAPHLSEELWERLGHQPSVGQQAWPVYDPALVVIDRLELPIQVNGKLRGKISVAVETGREEVLKLAQQEPKIQEALQGKEPKKVIYVEKKLINFVV